MREQWVRLFRRRTAAGATVIAVIAVIVFAAWWLIVPGADWLARHDVGLAHGTALVNARNNARGALLTLGAGVVAAGALVFTARNFALSRRTLALTEQGQRRSFELTEQAQVTDRYTKAIEQLGSDKPDIRIGGIYALERIAFDSARDHPTVMEVLSTFVREHSRDPKWAGSDTTQPGQADGVYGKQPGADIQAAATVIGRRNSRHDTLRINLFGANLTLMDLTGVDLAGVKLYGANLSRADLTGADLSGANLSGAFLTGANLTGANLSRADLSRADLTGAFLTGANLTGAFLTGTDLSGAFLSGAFTAAGLSGAKLTAVPGGTTSRH